MEINEIHSSSVQLIGWGSPSSQGKVSSTLRRAHITVIPQQSVLYQKPILGAAAKFTTTTLALF
jgi:hypothetical protein